MASTWTPDALAKLTRDAFELMRWAGRDEVFADAEVEFAISGGAEGFQEQIDFLRQKRPKPTKSWLDALKGDHDRAFVVAGVTDMELLEGIQSALIESRDKGTGLQTFATQIDDLAAKHGWDIPGDRDWRIRTIFETNMRTSFMAGRLRQMRDPDVVKGRPYWQYLHADIRIPKSPRPQHRAWNGLVLRWDDPWWETHFPPNDWGCSCGVRTLSTRDLERLGKTGPDTAPPQGFEMKIVKGVGTVNQPAGIGYGWDYMPGDRWDRGLVPSKLLDDPLAVPASGRNHIVSIDTAEPAADLATSSPGFRQKVLPTDQTADEYRQALMQPFLPDTPSAALPPSLLFTDVSGTRLLISDAMFRRADGSWKGGKRFHAEYAGLLAEAIIDPDEIWLGVREVPNPAIPTRTDLVMTRRYIKVDPETALFAMFELGREVWGAVTGYATFNRAKPDFSHLDKQRVGKLIWKRRPG